ncbi:MAG TPA: SpoIID/LytB domain-containing protein [Terriglobales bacterium]
MKLSGDSLLLTSSNSPVSELLITGNYKLLPEQQPALAAAFPLQITARQGALQIVASMALEDYVGAAVAGESGDFKDPEALKAMAVAIRSYAARFRPRHKTEDFDFCDNTHCQELNFAAISPQVQAAVEATKGQMLWYEGVPAATYYHQNCGGRVAAANEIWSDTHVPYLPEHVDPYCPRSAPLNWEARLTHADLERALRQENLPVLRPWTSLLVAARDSSGRATKLALISGAGPRVIIPAAALRLAVGRSLGWNRIRSDLYSVQTQADLVIFSGQGSGHGVGLCQAGAEEMAREGKSYKEILSFYYPGTSLSAVSSLDWKIRKSQRFEMMSVRPDQDAAILPIAERLLKKAEDEVGWQIGFQPHLQVFPSVDAYRNSTGQPGWVAATTRGRTVRLQPLEVLKDKSSLESTLQHEFFHLVIEAHARSDTPLWFREGLALYFSDPRAACASTVWNEDVTEAALRRPQNQDSVKRAYTAARCHVASLIEQYGKETVLNWLTDGLPNRSNLGLGGASQH